MPRVRRQGHRRKGYGQGHFHEMLTGHYYCGPGFNYDRLESAADYAINRGATPDEAAAHRRRFDAVRAEMQAVWEELQDWMLDEWLHSDEPCGMTNNSARGGMCTRPWAWWVFDAPEPRRQISDGPLNSTMADDYPHPHGGKLYFGVPRSLGTSTDWDCRYELQGQYLERLGLFVDGEAECWAEHKDAWLAEIRAEGMDETLE